MKFPIKFRGVDLRTGEFVYGDYVSPVDDLHAHQIQTDNGLRSVMENSIAQLVGFDKYGKEIYEGDLFKDPHGTAVFAAKFIRNTPLDSSCILVKEADH